MSRRLLIILLVSFLAASAAVGSPQSEASGAARADIVFWDMIWGPQDTYPVAAQQIVDQFNRANPAVNVKLQMIAWDNWYQTFLTAVSSGAGPDVATSSSTAPFFYDRMGELAPLDSILAEWKTQGKLDDIPSYAYGAFNYDGRQMAIPWNVDGRLFFYRTDVFESLGISPPNDWDELLAALRKIKAGTDMFPMVFPGDNMLKHLGYAFQAMNNVGSVDTSGKPNLTDPRNIEVLRFFQTLAVEELIPPGTLGYEDTDAQRIYFEGKAAILFEGTTVLPLDYPEIASRSGILPVFKGPSGDAKTTITFVNPIMVFRQTKSLDASKAFVKFYSENNLPLWTSSSMSQFPVRKSFLAQPFFQSNWIVTDIAKKILPFGRPGGLYPQGSEFPGWGAINGEGYIRVMLQQVLTEKQGADLAAIAKATHDKVAAAIANAEAE